MGYLVCMWVLRWGPGRKCRREAPVLRCTVSHKQQLCSHTCMAAPALCKCVGQLRQHCARLQHNTPCMLRSTATHSTAPHGTAQHCTTQHSTAQHSAATQRNPRLHTAQLRFTTLHVHHSVQQRTTPHCPTPRTPHHTAQRCLQPYIRVEWA